MEKNEYRKEKQEKEDTTLSIADNSREVLNASNLPPFVIRSSSYSRTACSILFQQQEVLLKVLSRMKHDGEMLGQVAAGTLEIQGKKAKTRSSSSPIHEILERIRQSKKRNQTVFADFVRLDYIETTAGGFKQVEMNTVSCSFLFKGPQVNKWHQSNTGPDVLVSNSDQEFIKLVEVVWRMYLDQLENEKNPRTSGINETATAESAIIESVPEATATIPTALPGPIFVLLDAAEASQQNAAEKQEILEEIRKKGIPAIAVNVEDMLRTYSVRDNRLFIGENEVFMVYYRWLYNANQYTEDIIKLRIEIESTQAISVPDVESQIVGLKIFQPLLCIPSFISRYLQGPEEKQMLPELSSLFVSFMTVDEYLKKTSKESALQWVLKPLNEGGGGNFFGQEVPIRIQQIEEKEKAAYILMEEIKGKKEMNAPASDTSIREMVGELGIFGSIITRKEQTVSRSAQSPITLVSAKVSGYILRLKNSDCNETGVSAGYGFLGSIQLV